MENTKNKWIRDPLNIFILIYFFSPSPNAKMGFLIKIVLISCYSIYSFGIKNNKNKINHIFNVFMNICKKNIALFSIIGLSFIYELLLLLFVQPFSISNLSYSYRPLYFLIIFVFSYYHLKKNCQIKYLIKLTYLVLIAAYFISILQLFDINIFSILYDDSKAFPIGQLVRLTGLFSNPNIFAWFIAQQTMFIILFENNRKNKILFIGLGVLFLLLSGSRTLILVGPLMWITMLVFKNLLITKNYKNVIALIAILFIFFSLIIFVLTILKDQLPYASQLLNIFKGGLKNVNSFKLRITAWEKHINILLNNRKFLLFGYAQATYSSVDNDVLYIITRSGIIGLALQIILILIIVYSSFSKGNTTYMGLFVIISLFFSGIIGLQADTISGWNYVPLIIFYFGLDKKTIS